MNWSVTLPSRKLKEEDFRRPFAAPSSRISTWPFHPASSFLHPQGRAVLAGSIFSSQRVCTACTVTQKQWDTEQGPTSKSPLNTRFLPLALLWAPGQGRFLVSLLGNLLDSDWWQLLHIEQKIKFNLFLSFYSLGYSINMEFPIYG